MTLQLAAIATLTLVCHGILQRSTRRAHQAARIQLAFVEMTANFDALANAFDQMLLTFQEASRGMQLAMTIQATPQVGEPSVSYLPEGCWRSIDGYGTACEADVEDELIGLCKVHAAELRTEEDADA